MIAFLRDIKEDRFNTIDFATAIFAMWLAPEPAVLAGAIWLATSVTLNIFVAVIIREA